MEILDLVPGTDEWEEKRLDCCCASEAPVVQGESKFMSRKQLLALKKGWKSNPVGDFKQKLYDKGHEHEDDAREITELEWCEEFPPVVGLLVVDSIEMLASFDGLEGGEIGGIHWEHKSWNATLAENVNNSVLEPLYYWQLEHQMLVAGTEHCVFTCSDGTEDKRVSMTYRSVPERRAELIAGWKQFLIDLDEYEIEAKEETVIAKVQKAFPLIECRVEGSTVISNLGEYIPLIQQLSEEQMSIVLDTDQDFIDKDAFNKNVKKGRESLKLDASKIETEFKSLAKFNGFVKQADKILQKLQSHGEKQVKDSKATKKLAMTNGARELIIRHMQDLSATINGIPLHNQMTDWDSTIKGKRNFEKMQDAIDSEIARLKIHYNEQTAIIRKNLDSFVELASEHRFLFSDHSGLMLKDNDDLVNLIKTRISEHDEAEKKRLADEAEEAAEKAREKIRKEEQKKAEDKSYVNQTIRSWTHVADCKDVNSVSDIDNVLSFMKKSLDDDRLVFEDYKATMKIYDNCYNKIVDRKTVLQAEHEKAKKAVTPEPTKKAEVTANKGTGGGHYTGKPRHKLAATEAEKAVNNATSTGAGIRLGGQRVDLEDVLQEPAVTSVNVTSKPGVLTGEGFENSYVKLKDEFVSEAPVSAVPTECWKELSAWSEKHRLPQTAIRELEEILNKYL